MYTDRLLAKYPIISDQVEPRELRTILMSLEQQIRTQSTGALVEFGCYTGTISLFVRRMMDLYEWPGEYHVYDSFAGLPEKTAQDDSPAGLQFRAGELAVSKREFTQQFRRANLRLPHIHKGWFNELHAHDVPDDIIWAFLDGDYYESIRDSLVLITPKLASNAIVVVDDYANEALPGAAKAVDEWCLRNAHRSLRIQSSLALITL